MKVTRSRLVALTAVGVGAALAVAVPAGAAVSVQSQSPPLATVNLGAKATLDAKGAVVFAPVRVVCAPGAYAYLRVKVVETVGGGIASGDSESIQVTCTGSVQKIRVSVTPTQKPYRAGVAFGRATFDVCDNTCVTVFDERNIQIVK